MSVSDVRIYLINSSQPHAEIEELAGGIRRYGAQIRTTELNGQRLYAIVTPARNAGELEGYLTGKCVIATFFFL